MRAMTTGSDRELTFFAEATELPVEQRDAFSTRRWRGDEGLLRRVHEQPVRRMGALKLAKPGIRRVIPCQEPVRPSTRLNAMQAHDAWEIP
jgi:hypothetical protein